MNEWINGNRNIPNGSTKLNVNLNKDLNENPIHSRSLLNENIGARVKLT